MIQQYYAKNAKIKSKAYGDFDTMSNASLFALDTIEDISKTWGVTPYKAYALLEEEGTLEDYILYHHNSLHQFTPSIVINMVNDCYNKKED